MFADAVRDQGRAVQHVDWRRRPAAILAWSPPSPASTARARPRSTRRTSRCCGGSTGRAHAHGSRPGGGRACPAWATAPSCTAVPPSSGTACATRCAVRCAPPSSPRAGHPMWSRPGGCSPRGPWRSIRPTPTTSWSRWPARSGRRRRCGWWSARRAAPAPSRRSARAPATCRGSAGRPAPRSTGCGSSVTSPAPRSRRWSRARARWTCSRWPRRASRWGTTCTCARRPPPTC